METERGFFDFVEEVASEEVIRSWLKESKYVKHLISVGKETWRRLFVELTVKGRPINGT
jgi:hypothetical protein